MSLKKSVMFSDQAVTYITARTRDQNDIAWSQSVNRTFEAVEWLSRYLLPELNQQEWELILNTYAGCITDFHRPLRIASDMMDNFGEVDINDLSPEIAGVVRKCHALSQPQQFAVMDFINVFWSRDWSSFKNWDDIYNHIIGAHAGGI